MTRLKRANALRRLHTEIGLFNEHTTDVLRMMEITEKEIEELGYEIEKKGWIITKLKGIKK